MKSKIHDTSASELEKQYPKNNFKTMINKILLLSALLLSTLAFSQVPQGIQYQAIALSGSGTPVVSSNVGVKLSLLDNSASGTLLYAETHVKMTNAQGLFNLVIGQGTPVTGTFAAVNWGTNPKFLKVEMDAAGGTNYALMGTTQLLSVPYAMVAASLAPSASGNSLADQISESTFTNFGFLDFSANKAYVYNARTGTWSNQAFSASASPDLLESSGNFAFLDFSANKAYVFNSKTNTWSSQAFNASASPTLIPSRGNYGFIDFSDNKAYAFNSKTGTWSAQAFNASASPDLIGVNGSFAFIDYSDNKAYAFNASVGLWKSQSFNASASPDLIPGTGSAAFIDYSDNKVYAFNPATGTWVAQSFSASANPDLIQSVNE